jgi:hypothetical protein
VSRLVSEIRSWTCCNIIHIMMFRCLVLLPRLCCSVSKSEDSKKYKACALL